MPIDVTVIGDSNAAAGFANSTTATRSLTKGWSTWAQAYCGNHSSSGWNNVAVGGAISSEFMAQLDTALAGTPDLILVQATTNDLGVAALPLPVIYENYLALIKKAHKAKVDIAFIAPFPRHDLSATQNAKRDKIKSFLEQFHKANLIVHYIDPEYALAGVSSIQNAYYSDDLHLNDAGAERIGWAIARHLNARLPAPITPPITPDDLYIPSTQNFGNIVENASLSTSEAASGSQNSGDIATGASSAFSSQWPGGAATLTHSHSADATYGIQKNDITGATPANANDAIHYLTLPTLTPDQEITTLVAGVELCFHDLSGASSIYLQIKDTGGNTHYHEIFRNINTSTSLIAPLNKWIAIKSTPISRIAPDSSLAYRLVTRALANQTVAISYSIRKPFLRASL